MNSYENPQLSYECDLTAERDRLREINKELLTALEVMRGAMAYIQEFDELPDDTCPADLFDLCDNAINGVKGEA